MRIPINMKKIQAIQTLEEMINLPLGITVVFLRSAVPSSTGLSLSSNGNIDLSSCTTNIIR